MWSPINTKSAEQGGSPGHFYMWPPPQKKVPKWRICTGKRPREGVFGGSLFSSLCSGNLLNEVEGDDNEVYSMKWKRKTSVAFTSPLQPLVLLCLYLCPCLYLSLCLSVSVSVSLCISLFFSCLANLIPINKGHSWKEWNTLLKASFKKKTNFIHYFTFIYLFIHLTNICWIHNVLDNLPFRSIAYNT